MKRFKSQQAVFDHVLRFIRNQRAPSCDREGNCRNTMPDGRRCHVACLYTPASARKFPVTVLVSDATSRGLDIHFVDALQQAHDCATHSVWGVGRINPEDNTVFMIHVERNMSLVAERFMLQYEAPHG